MAGVSLRELKGLCQVTSLLYFNFHRLFPVIEADLSDSGNVDNVLELLVMAGGRSLPEVIFK